MAGAAPPSEGIPDEAAVALGVGSWVWDIDRGSFRASTPLRLLHGVPEDDEVPAGLDDLLSVMGPPGPDGPVGGGWATGRLLGRIEQQVRIVRPTGEVREVLRRARVEYGADGRPSRILGLDIDLGAGGPDAPARAAGPLAGIGIGFGVAEPAPPAPGPIASPDASSAPPIDPRAAETSAGGMGPEWLGAVLQALPVPVVVLGPDGTVLHANRAWTAFGEAGGTEPGASTRPGASYLDACRSKPGLNPGLGAGGGDGADRDAVRALAGIEGVLAGALPFFEMEHPCHRPGSDGDPAGRRWFLMSAVPVALEGGTGGTRAGAVVSHIEITGQKEAEARLRESESLLRATFQGAPTGLGLLSPENRWLRANARLADLLGRTGDAVAGLAVADHLHPDDIDIHAIQLEVVRAGAIDTARYDVRLRRPDGTDLWIAATLACERDPAGGIVHFVLGAEDATAARRLEARHQTLLDELSHRAKNLLTVIQAITRRTLGPGTSSSEAREALLGRFEALARSYGVLAGDGFEGVPLRDILESELAPYGARVRIEGPDLLLAPKAMQTFALVAHELATNAAKYGPLAGAEGGIDVTWSVEGDRRSGLLRLDWRERGGPPARAPVRQGFGTALIGRLAGIEFGCEPVLRYGEEGFSYAIEAPLARMGAVVADSPLRRRLRHPAIVALFDAWTRQRPPDGLPGFAGFDWSRFAATGAMTIARIGADGTTAFVQVGRDLTDRLGEPVGGAGGAKGDEGAGSDAAALDGLRALYGRCAAAGQPRHDRMRLDFGDGSPLAFERLLVPLSALEGAVATHVAGLVVIEGEPGPG